MKAISYESLYCLLRILVQWYEWLFIRWHAIANIHFTVYYCTCVTSDRDIFLIVMLASVMSVDRTDWLSSILAMGTPVSIIQRTPRTSEGLSRQRNINVFKLDVFAYWHSSSTALACNITYESNQGLLLGVHVDSVPLCQEFLMRLHEGLLVF